MKQVILLYFVRMFANTNPVWLRDLDKNNPIHFLKLFLFSEWRKNIF